MVVLGWACDILLQPLKDAARVQLLNEGGLIICARAKAFPTVDRQHLKYYPKFKMLGNLRTHNKLSINLNGS
jgi:hypothetical protein